MTSVYGGIRWGSGICRQMQYEHGQSRIGTTLWNKGGLDLYLEKSSWHRWVMNCAYVIGMKCHVLSTINFHF